MTTRYGGREGFACGQRGQHTCPFWSRNSVSVQYPEATPIALRTVCRVPGQIEVLKSFQGMWGLSSPRG